jgi:hypothetical protein
LGINSGSAEAVLTGEPGWAQVIKGAALALTDTAQLRQLVDQVWLALPPAKALPQASSEVDRHSLQADVIVKHMQAAGLLNRFSQNN